MRVGDHHRPVEKARILEPGGAGHLAIAVEREPSGEDGIVVCFAAGKNGGDSGAHRAFADYELALARDERGVSDFNAFDVGDGVVRAGSAVEGNSQTARARLGLGQSGNC